MTKFQALGVLIFSLGLLSVLRASDAPRVVNPEAIKDKVSFKLREEFAVQLVM